MDRSKRRKKILVLSAGGAVLLLVCLLATAVVWTPTPVISLDLLRGLKPVRTYEEPVTTRHRYTQGKRYYYKVNKPFEQALASVAAQLPSEDGWRRSTVQSSSRIILFAQKLPGDEFCRCTIGVQEGWFGERETTITVSEPSRRIGAVEKAILWIRGRVGL